MPQIPAFDFETSLGAAIFATARRLAAAMTKELEPHGITFTQWNVLALLMRKDGLTQAQIAKSCGIEAPTACRLLDRMERDGWIQRRVHKQDRRCKYIYLRTQSLPIWNRMTAAAMRVRERALQDLSPSQQDQLLRTLEHIRSNLSLDR